MDLIDEFLRTNLGIADEELLHKLMGVSYIRNLQKGEYLFRQGESIDTVCFVIHGLFRFFSLDYQGKEMTDCFAYRKGTPVMPAADIQEPLPLNIIALENSSVLVIPVAVVKKLLEESMEAVCIYNNLLIQSITYQQQSKMVLYQYTAAQRYEWFLENHVGLIDRVPHSYIASYLGITPVTLSRLRSKLASQKKAK